MKQRNKVCMTEYMRENRTHEKKHATKLNIWNKVSHRNIRKWKQNKEEEKGEKKEVRNMRSAVDVGLWTALTVKTLLIYFHSEHHSPNSSHHSNFWTLSYISLKFISSFYHRLFIYSVLIDIIEMVILVLVFSDKVSIWF